MRVLITGGCGFIGTAVTDLLLRRGMRVLNLDKMTPAANPDALAEWAGTPRYRVREGDACDLNLVLQMFEEFEPDQVIHCAAENGAGSAAELGNAPYLQTNFIGTYTLLEAARTWWAGRAGDHRFQLISTEDVYGKRLGDAEPAHEGMAFRPATPSAASKAAACHLAQAWGETYNIDVMTTICANNFGPWQMPENFVPAVITHGMEGQPVPILGASGAVRNWAHVQDHAEAIRLVQEHGKTGETYNIGGPVEHTNANMVHLICSELDTHMPQNAPHSRMIEMPEVSAPVDEHQAMDSTKIWRDLRWRPETDFRTGLSDTVQWYLSHRPWWEAARRRSGADQSGRRAA